MSLAGTAIEAREKQFPLFLLTVVLPLAVLPFAGLQGSGWNRFALPLAINLLALQSLRTMPPWQGRLVGVPLQRLYELVGILAAIDAWIPALLGHNVLLPVRVLFVSIRALFFVATGIRLLFVLAGCRKVNARSLCLGAAGYIQMGLTCGLLATLLQLLDAHSFQLGASTQGQELLARLTYFAFVTIGTLGYGDVVPGSPIGESFVVLTSLFSTLYVNLLIGLLLSRYIDSRNQQALLEAKQEGEAP